MLKEIRQVYRDSIQNIFGKQHQCLHRLLAVLLVSSFLVSDMVLNEGKSQVFASIVNIGVSDDHMSNGSHDGHNALDLIPLEEIAHYPIKSGNWSDVSIWKDGKIPTDGVNVLIAEPFTVYYDVNSSTALNYLRVDGELHFSTNKNTKLVLDTLVTSKDSILSIGTIEDPIMANYSAEIIIGNKTYFDQDDIDKIGRGIVTYGKVAMYGAEKESHLRLEIEPSAGDTKITVTGSTTNWVLGDELVIIGTKLLGEDSTGELQTQDEVRTITQINGNTITLDRALQYDHKTPSFDVEKSPIKEIYTHVGNLSRNIVIRSEDSNQAIRGHFMAHQAADVRYVEFRDLGRTDSKVTISAGNPRGRYPLHLHETGNLKTQPKSYIVGNAVIGSPSWGIVQHSSHAAIMNNVVFDMIGAGIISENGDETGEWIGNLVTKIVGVKNPPEHCPEEINIACDGDAYFNNSRAIIQQKNIAANAKVGWNFFGREDLFFYDDGTQAPQTKDGPWRSVFDHTELEVFPNAYDNAIDHEEVAIIDFNDNEMIGVLKGIHAFHRQTSEATDTKNSFRRMIVWEAGTAADMKNYVSNYAFIDSLFIGKQGSENGQGVVTERKSAAQSLVNVHMENLNYQSYSLNFESANVNLTFTNGGIIQKDLMKTATSQMRTQLIKEFKSEYNMDYENPENNFLTLASSQAIDPVKDITFDILPGADLDIGPSDKTINFQATYNDSLGGVSFNNYLIAQPPNGNGTTEKHDGIDVILSGTRKYMNLQDFLRIHGTYQKSNGEWISPVVNWVGDRFNGVNHPVIVEIELEGWTDEYLTDFQRAYPQPKVSWGENILVELPVSSGINKPVIDEPVAEEPVAEDPVIDEPVVEEPVVEEPVVEEPVIDEPVMNSSPIISDDLFEFNLSFGDIQTIGNVLENDSDLDGDELRVVSVTSKKVPVSNTRRNGDNGGRILISENGDVSIKSTSEFDKLGAGDKIETVIEYEVSDSAGNRSQANLLIEVKNYTVEQTTEEIENTPVITEVEVFIPEPEEIQEIIPEAIPIANDDAFRVFADIVSSIPGNVLTNDTDANGDSLKVISTTQQKAEIKSFRNGSNGGRILIGKDGEVTFKHGNDFEELDSGQTVKTEIIYEISDGKGGKDQATVTFYVTGR